MQDIVYWIDYYAKFGTSHLHAPAHHVTLWEKNDVDIKVGLAFFFIVFLLLLFMIADTICRSLKICTQ